MFCTFDIPFLTLYTHIPVLVTAFFVGFFIYLQDRESLAHKYFFIFTSLFCFWVVSSLLQWYIHDVEWNLFLARISIWYVFSMPVFVFFVRALIKAPLSNTRKWFYFLLLLPVFGLTFSSYNTSIDPNNCDTEFGPLYFYIGFLCLFYLGEIIWSLFKSYRTVQEKKIHSQIKILSFAIGFFLFWFLGLSVAIDAIVRFGYGEEWIAQVLPFGMLIFLAIVVYAMRRYSLFNIKLITASLATVVIWILIGALYFLLENENLLGRTFVIITFLLSILAGLILIRSVRAEVQRKEELEKLTESLAIANDRLEELDRQKSEFVSIASHQLRTPLTAIRGYISLALDGSYGNIKGTQIEDLMNKMYTIDLRLSQLVEDLLNVSKIEMGKVQYNWENVALESVVKELHDMFTVLADKKGLKLQYKGPSEALPMMRIDVGKIKELLSNLIDNAIKYTEEGGVTVSIESTDTLARVLIKDTGIGISKENAARLFQKFIRTEQTKKMDSGGSGLGLFVGKTFVEGHGGRVYAESEGEGKGSTFIVELPLVNPNTN